MPLREEQGCRQGGIQEPGPFLVRATEGGKAIHERDSESDPQSASTYSRTWKYQKDFRHSLLPFAIYLFVKTDEQNLLSGQLSTHEVFAGEMT